jgi:hypothetical protein
MAADRVDPVARHGVIGRPAGSSASRAPREPARRLNHNRPSAQLSRTWTIFRLGEPGAPAHSPPNYPSMLPLGRFGGGAGWCDLNEKCVSAQRRSEDSPFSCLRIARTEQACPSAAGQE